jgi:hypothetical protein
MGNMSLFEKEIKEHNQKHKIFEFTERCKKCFIGRMVHIELYTYKCSHCGYEYEVDPNAPKGVPVREKFINED